MTISTILDLGIDVQPPTPQHMGSGEMGALFMGMHWGWWLITVLVLGLLTALILRAMGGSRDDT